MSCTKDLPVIYDRDWELAEKEIAKYIPSFMDQLNWREDEIIMDHGCATGRSCLKFLVPRIESFGKAKIYAVDKSRCMIEFAQENYPHPKVTYTATDLLSPTFPYNDVTFDKIFSFFVLCHIHDEETLPTLRKMYELLAPGGFLILLDVLESHHHDLQIHIDEHPELELKARKYLVVPERFGNEATFHEDSRKAYGDLLQDAGFKMRDCKTVASSYAFGSTHAMAEFFMSVDPVAHEAVGEVGDHFEEFYDVALKLMSEQQGVDPEKAKEEGEYEIKYKLIYIMAEKPLAE